MHRCPSTQVVHAGTARHLGLPFPLAPSTWNRSYPFFRNHVFFSSFSVAPPHACSVTIRDLTRLSPLSACPTAISLDPYCDRQRNDREQTQRSACRGAVPGKERGNPRCRIVFAVLADLLSGTLSLSDFRLNDLESLRHLSYLYSFHKDCLRV